MNSDSKKAREKCHLCAKQGINEWCSRDRCVFWRLLETQDEDLSNMEGCGLSFFELLDELTPETAEWLLGMKRRLENTRPSEEKARINFRRREY